MADLENIQTPPQESDSQKQLRHDVEGYIKSNDLEGLLKHIEQMAHYDSLTRVLNRAGFLSKAQPELERISRLPENLDRRTGEILTLNVLFLDLDHFKNINDTYGHAAGDAALQQVADVLKKSLREDDIIGRFGGEEFVVAFSCSATPTLIRRNRFVVAEKVRAAIENGGFMYNGQQIPFTASIGLAQLRQGEGDIEKVLARADKAMYTAKESGRNRIAISDET